MNIIVSLTIYRMKWGVDEFIFAISSDSEFYRLIDAVIKYVQLHTDIYILGGAEMCLEYPKNCSVWCMLTLKWLATVGGPLLALSPFVAELSRAAIFFLDNCGNNCMCNEIENRGSTSSKPSQCLHSCSC